MPEQPPTTYARIELVGTSEQGVAAAIRTAVHRAARTLQGLDWFAVQEMRGTITGGTVDHFQVALEVGFRVMRPEDLLAELVVGEAGGPAEGEAGGTAPPADEGADEALPPAEWDTGRR